MTVVEERLKKKIRADGPMPFAQFMDEALYGEGGYYNRKALPIGPAGDYVTGSSHSPLFGRTTARLLGLLDAELGRPAEFLEAGYGNGRHLAALVGALGRESGRRLLGWDRIPRPLPAGVEGLDSLDLLQGGAIEGVVFSYELFDALPVHRLVGTPEGLDELWVDLSPDGRFEWRRRQLSDPALAELVTKPLARDQIADVSPGWRPLYRALASKLGGGLLVTIDYGFRAKRLFDPRVRRHGTLACYRRQRLHRDPFVAVGEQDLTAHVDFSALIETGEAAGLETVVFTRQAAWLAALGLLEGMERRPPDERAQALELMNLEGMGEELRVLVQARGVEVGKILPAELL